MVFVDWAEWEGMVTHLAGEAVAIREGDHAFGRFEALEH